MVSVVIPVYNGEKFVLRTIECVLSQSFKVEQIIVIDDASTDRTQELILKEFPKEVIYHRNEKNMERCYSRNLGASLAKGEYIFFLDHDDLWEKEHVEKVLENWGDAHIVYAFPRKYIDDEGKLMRVSKKRLPADVGVLIFSGMIGFPSATAFKKESFEEYEDEFMLREDWEVFIRAYFKGLKIKVIDTNTVMIREHSGRTSKSRRLYEGTLKVYEIYKDRVPKEYLSYFLFHVGETCMRFADLKRGWAFVLKALAEKPSLFLSGRRLLSLLKRGLRFYSHA
jgi:glycosyltransferase involved in cell wall biosynthesis